MRSFSIALILIAAQMASAQGPSQRFQAAQKRIAPIEARAGSDFDKAKYGEALQGYETAASQWTVQGFSNPHAEEIAECYLALGQPHRVIQILKTSHLTGSPMAATCEALAYLSLNQETSARPLYQDQFISRSLPSLSYMLLPPKKTKSQFEATLHLARGINCCVTGRTAWAERELRTADRLSAQPLTAYYLGKLLLLDHRSTQAKPYLKRATVLKGPLGQEAKRLMTSS